MPLFPQLPIPQGRQLGSGTNYYVIPGVGAIASTTAKVATASRIQYEPMIVDTTETYDLMICEVTVVGAGGTVIRMAIYAMDIDGQPGVRLADAGTVTADSLAVKTAAISLTLAPGRYLKAWISDGTPTLRSVRAGGQITTAFDTTLGTSPVVGGLRVAGSGSTLPDPGTAWTTPNFLSTGFDHCVWLRKSVA